MRPSDQLSLPKSLDVEGGNNNEIKPQGKDDNPEAKLSACTETAASPIDTPKNCNTTLNSPLALAPLEPNGQESFNFSFTPGWKILASSETKEEENLLRRSTTLENSSIRPPLRHSSTFGRVSRYHNHFAPSSP